MSNTKILFVTNDSGDFLADSFLVGLKLNNHFVVETKVKKIVYKSEVVNPDIIHGKGFTLYGIIDINQALEVDRDINMEYINSFDFVIFSSIQRQYGMLLHLLPFLQPSKTIMLDGEDVPNLFFYSGNFWRRKELWLMPKVHKKFKYFKREITSKTNVYRFYRMVPYFIAKLLPLPKNVLPISFSIPSIKITNSLPLKKKLFPKHIVDKEVCNNVSGATDKYAFTNEEEYYKDLQESKFGITTKRAGWDCLRHYEIAANGAIICFKNLSNKPRLCAPHGLIPGYNCISYNNYEDLIRQISLIDDNHYNTLQKNSLEWVKSKSCENLTKEILSLVKLKNQL